MSIDLMMTLVMPHAVTATSTAVDAEVVVGARVRPAVHYALRNHRVEPGDRVGDHGRLLRLVEDLVVQPVVVVRRDRGVDGSGLELARAGDVDERIRGAVLEQDRKPQLRIAGREGLHRTEQRSSGAGGDLAVEHERIGDDRRRRPPDRG